MPHASRSTLKNKIEGPQGWGVIRGPRILLIALIVSQGRLIPIKVMILTTVETQGAFSFTDHDGIVTCSRPLRRGT